MFANVFKVLNEHYQLPNAQKIVFELQKDNKGRDNTGKSVEDATDFDVCIREETILYRKRKFEVIEKDIDDAVEGLIQLVEDSLSNKLSKKRYKKSKTTEEKQQHEKEKHPILPGCKESCTRKCHVHFTKECRLQIHNEYWGLSKTNQMQWLSHSIDTITPKCPRKNTAEKKERKYTRIFFLEKNHQKVQACQKIFLSTLGLKGDRVVRTTLAKSNDSRTDICDNRGKHEPGNKKSEEISALVISHI